MPEVEALVPVVGEGVAPAGVAAVEAGRALRARQRARAAAPEGGEGREAVVASLQRSGVITALRNTLCSRLKFSLQIQNITRR